MDGSRLLIDMGTLFTRFRDFRQLLRKEDCEARLKARCALVDSHHGVNRQLEGIARERPDLYEFALCAAGLTLPLSQSLQLSEAAGDALFLAALLQDCGQLQSSAAAEPDDAPLSHESHPTRGSELIRARCTVPGAVIEHIANQHERYDGTGYPDGKLEPELSDGDLALSIVNELVRIRISTNAPAEKTLTDCMPILRFNQGPHFTRACRDLLNMVGAAGIAAGAVWAAEDAQRHIEELVDDVSLLQRWLQQLAPLRKALGAAKMSRGVARCLLLAESLRHAAASSGIADTSMVRWAEHVGRDGLAECHGELQEIAALQAELFYRLDWFPEFLDALARETGALSPALQALRHNMARLKDYRARRRGEDELIVMDI